MDEYNCMGDKRFSCQENQWGCTYWALPETCASGECASDTQCLICDDADFDGHDEYDADTCPAGDDYCDLDEHNWSSSGCASCVDDDGDGYGADCDKGEDCDDEDETIHEGCVVDGDLDEEFDIEDELEEDGDADTEFDGEVNLCGNSQIDDGEECELEDSVACTTLGSVYIGGTATCNGTCDGWDRSGCEWDTTPGFVPITAGSFWMGSPQSSTCPEGYPGVCEDELGNDSDEVLHEVILTYDFEMSRYEITEAEFEGLMGWNAMDTYDSDCTYGCGDDHPMQYISWLDTLAYANQLSLDAGLTVCYVLSNVACVNGGNVGSDYMNCFDSDTTYGGIDSATVTLAGGVSKPQDCEGYRLPTEAEWEYSTRAGSNTAFYQSEGNNGTITCTGTNPVDPNLTQIAWFGGNNTPNGTKPVGGKEPNTWGLYDMSGNLWEWTWDWYQSAYQNDVATDPMGPSTGSDRVLHGGLWKYEASYCRSANRLKRSSGFRHEVVGARLCRSLPAVSPICDDNIINGNETDVDCGGDACQACEDHRNCEENDDCQSGVCGGDNTCAEATCDDGIQNGDETGVDCGGSCDACAIPTPDFVPITADTFWMGSPQSSTCPAGYPGVCEDELGRTFGEVLHEVTLTYNFEMSRYEITEAEFEGLMGWNPMDTYDSDCSYGCGDDHPVKYVSWYDMLAYANKLSSSAGLTACYELSNVGCENGGNVGSDYMDCFDGDSTYGGIDSATVTLAGGAIKPQDCEGYRLPTEAEWEYAIRAGTTTAFYNGGITEINCDPADPNLSLIGWFCGNNSSSGTYGTKPVGGKAPNGWGLYDMSGNVREWSWDWYQNSYQNDVGTDPVGLSTGSYRVRRGGHWSSNAVYCRSASRGIHSTGNRSFMIGSRLSRSLPGTAPTCNDNIHNGDETDVDCGGSCDACAIPIPAFVPIPSGTFWMGCTPGDTNCNGNESPRYEVTVSAFYMTQTEVTNEQYIVFLNANGNTCDGNGCVNIDSSYLRLSYSGGVWSVDSGYEDHPLVEVTWYGAKAFCEWSGGRLPSEAEWEYAARAGTETIYYCGDSTGCLDDIAWYYSNSNSSTHPVGDKTSNSFGLYDMLGNVWEWTEDCWHSNYDGHSGTGGVWAGGDCSYRALRGSCWSLNVFFLRSSYRLNTDPTRSDYNYGFRCSRD